MPVYLSNLPIIDEDLYVYYSSLSVDERTVYKELYAGFTRRLDSFSVSTTDTEELFKCYSSVLLEHPEIFYVSGYSYEKGESLLVQPKYSMSESVAKSYRMQCDNYAKRVIDSIPENSDVYDSIRYVYDYIASNTVYGENTNDQTMISVACDNQSVCLGYALMYQYCLQQLGIPNIVVTGTAYGTDHAWNVIQYDGKWYNSDVTWASQTYWYYDNSLKQKLVSYDYFLVSDATIRRDHTISMCLYVPVCSSDDLDYYQLNNLYLESCNEEQLQTIFADALKTDKHSLVLKCSDYTTFIAVRKYLIEDNSIFDLLNTTECSYTYSTDLCTLTFWF